VKKEEKLSPKPQAPQPKRNDDLLALYKKANERDEAKWKNKYYLAYADTQKPPEGS
jgi:hypothetical protein